MHRLADVPEAAAAAAKFAVPADIHADDFVFQHHLDVQGDPDRGRARGFVTDYYFSDGDRSARQLDELVRQHHPEAAGGRLALLEFAAGYGCVSRHLRRMDQRYDLVACDIHPQAVDFLRDRLDVPALLSRSRPGDVIWPRRFDVVFALSFFSHMPDWTFGDWLRTLYEALDPGGLLIFTTHGREAYLDRQRPALAPEGFWFSPWSEQKDLPVDEYGTMVATPGYVMNRIGRCPGAALQAFQLAAWWGKQDVFVVRRTDAEFPPTPATGTVTPDVGPAGFDLAFLLWQLAEAREEAREWRTTVQTIRQSRSWRITSPLRAAGRWLGRG